VSWKIEANNLNRMAVMLQAQGRTRESLAAFQQVMRGFYTQMLVSKKTKAEALRETQLELIRSSNWSSPRYWAPFILAGEWS
jgi:CHAT domain-containing protein